jgi:hypothetical protein
MDAFYKQEEFKQNNQDRIEKSVQRFRALAPCVIADTLIQLLNYSLIDKFIEMSEFVYNNDINQTVLNKLDLLCDEAEEYLKSDEYNAIKRMRF